MQRQIESVDTHESEIQEIFSNLENVQETLERRDSGGMSADLLFKFNTIDADLKAVKAQNKEEAKKFSALIDNLKIQIEEKCGQSGKILNFL